MSLARSALLLRSSLRRHARCYSEISTAPPGSSGSGGIVARRFYKSAHMRPADDGKNFVVMLDRWVLKTPLKKPVVVPTAGLALAIAAEWEYQITGIRPFTMPITKLTSTVIDRIPDTRTEVIQSLMQHLDSDSIYCRAPEDTPLAAKQSEVWDPLIDWVETKIGARPFVTSKILIGSQPKEVSQAFEKALKELTDWELASVDLVAASSKSLVIALAMLHDRLDVQEAIKVIRVDEDFQVGSWGLVEGGHDIDVSDLRVRVTSASVFLKLHKQ